MLKSLGWELLPLADDLRVPSGEFYGAPLVLTDEQADFTLRFYAVDEQGRFLFRRACLRRPKGWGKSPFAAFLVYCELVGPARFSGWDDDGEPLGRVHPAPWIQIAAVSEDQTDNTYVALLEMLRDSPALDRYGIDAGLTRVYLKGRGGRVEPVTSSSGSREGQPLTFAVLDQTESWVRTNGGVRLAATIRRNVAKMGGRTLEIPNAHVVGDGSVAEQSFRAFEKGSPGMLYDFREAPVVDDFSRTDELRDALAVAYGDSVRWVDLDRLVQECNDPATDPSDATRFYLNRPATGNDRAVDMRQWQALAVERLVEPGEFIGLGFDGSISDDATVLWGCTRDGFLFEIAAWERPPGQSRDWRVPRSEVHDTLADVFARYTVGMLLCDPPLWLSEIEEWARLYGEERVVELSTNSTVRFAPACDRFTTAVREGTLSHDGSELLTRHLAATARRKVRVNDPEDDGRSKFVFVKAGSQKIDASVAAVLAFQAAMIMPEPETPPEPFAFRR
jgi:hypothetical protein